MIDFDRNFPRYTDYPSEVPVWCLTPETPGVIHRFFDTSPISPSGRYLAGFQLPPHDDFPRPGDRAKVVVTDLETGEEKTVWETAGWEFQLGANINWGSDDSQLIFNDVDTVSWQPYAVVLDPQSGAWRKLNGTIYHASPDGKYIVSANLTAMRRTQGGYGVVVPDEKVPYYHGTTDEDGVWITDVMTGESRLLVSIRDAAEAAGGKRQQEYAQSEVYAFHTKWSPDGSRIMFSLRFFPDEKGKRFRAMNFWAKKLRYDVFSVKPDGSDIRLAIPAEQWDKLGHHTNWKNDSSGFTMNLNINEDGMRICQCDIDGNGLAPVVPFTGSGHPSFHINGRYGVTDCYRFEDFSAADNSVPLRFFDLENMTERALTYLQTKTEGDCREVDFRLDPHPVWCCNFELLVFNAIWRGARRIMAADMRKFL